MNENETCERCGYKRWSAECKAKCRKRMCPWCEGRGRCGDPQDPTSNPRFEYVGCGECKGTGEQNIDPPLTISPVEWWDLPIVKKE